MSTHTINTQKIVPLPHEQRTAVSIDTLDELEHSLDFIRFQIKKTNDELRVITAKLNKLRLILEIK